MRKIFCWVFISRWTTIPRVVEDNLNLLPLVFINQVRFVAGTGAAEDLITGTHNRQISPSRVPLHFELQVPLIHANLKVLSGRNPTFKSQLIGMKNKNQNNNSQLRSANNHLSQAPCGHSRMLRVLEEPHGPLLQAPVLRPSPSSTV